MLRLEDDDSLELRYLLVCAAMQADEPELATDEVCWPHCGAHPTCEPPRRPACDGYVLAAPQHSKPPGPIPSPVDPFLRPIRQLAKALEFARTPACPEDEQQWVEQLQELQRDMSEAHMES